MRVIGPIGRLVALTVILSGRNPVFAQEKNAETPISPGIAGNKTPETSIRGVDLLVEQIRRHPADPSEKEGQIPLYLMDARGGEATRIVVESEAGLNHNGSAVWSKDGRRILFDASPANSDYTRSRLKAIGLTEGGQISITDLGPGNCPEFGPDDEQIMFLLNSGAIPGAASGVWIMKGDGSERRRIESYGRPRWAPDNSRVLIVDFAIPHGVTLIDVRPQQQSGDLQLMGRKFFSPPRWAGEGIIIASIGEGEEADTIALIDVIDPAHCEVKKVLWKRGKELNVAPLASNLSTITGRCVFVGQNATKGLALYGFDINKSAPPTRLESEDFDTYLRDPIFSPDGRYIVFSSDRPERHRASGTCPDQGP